MQHIFEGFARSCQDQREFSAQRRTLVTTHQFGFEIYKGDCLLTASPVLSCLSIFTTTMFVIPPSPPGRLGVSTPWLQSINYQRLL